MTAVGSADGSGSSMVVMQVGSMVLIVVGERADYLAVEKVWPLVAWLVAALVASTVAWSVLIEVESLGHC